MPWEVNSTLEINTPPEKGLYNWNMPNIGTCQTVYANTVIYSEQLFLFGLCQISWTFGGADLGG